MHARVILGVGKGVLFREVSSVQECPHKFLIYTSVLSSFRSVDHSIHIRLFILDIHR